MNEFFNNLGSKEKLMIAIGGACLGLLIIVGVWVSYASDVEKLEKQIATQKTLERWMKNAGRKANQIRQNAKSTRSSNRQSLFAQVDRTARQSRLSSAMKSVNPEGSNKVHVQMVSAVFDDLMRWLENLENGNQITVSKINIDRLEPSGLVNARITLEGSS